MATYVTGDDYFGRLSDPWLSGACRTLKKLRHRGGQFGPDVYASWRRSSLGKVTAMLELRLILRPAAPLEGGRILDVGCGDGTLACAPQGPTPPTSPVAIPARG
jgi:2-polyprenyl-3-methyl-5-hydroxy-6-metoxy-1,4-benzoquinol methylase